LRNAWKTPSNRMAEALGSSQPQTVPRQGQKVAQHEGRRTDDARAAPPARSRRRDPLLNREDRPVGPRRLVTGREPPVGLAARLFDSLFLKPSHPLLRSVPVIPIPRRGAFSRQASLRRARFPPCCLVRRWPRGAPRECKTRRRCRRLLRLPRGHDRAPFLFLPDGNGKREEPVHRGPS
jgi:hypothetical protein